MELAILIPTLVAGIIFGVTVLVHALQKVSGSNPFRRGKAIEPSEEDGCGPDSPTESADPSTPGDIECQSPAAPTSNALECHLNHSFPASSLQWSGISLSVRDRHTGNKKRLLQGCCGVAFPGDLVALVGPSGAGKSTLLDVLAMRSCGGTVKGSILVSGRRVTEAQFRSISTYVPQEDVFVPTLSVWETLAFTAHLRLPGAFSKADREMLMAESLKNMGLVKVRDSQVGGVLPGGLAVRGLSGGERRRLSMACGVVGAPKIIYLDEPTSGLDGNAALVVMRCMGRLAAQQRIVVSSIHQPRAAIWELFSKVTVLSEGRMLYFGAISQVTDWFCGRLHYEFDPAVHGTASEWLSDLVSISFTEPPAHFKRSMRTLKDVEKAAALFAVEAARSGLAPEEAKAPKGDRGAREPAGGQARAAGDTKVQLVVDAASPRVTQEEETLAVVPTPAAAPATDMEVASARSQPTGWWNQWGVLQRRALQAYTRNPANVANRTVMSLFIGLIGGLVFHRRAPGRDGVTQDIDAIFFLTLVLALVPFTYMSMFVADRSFYIVDPARSLYRTSVYYLALVAVNMVVTVFNAGLVLLIIYSMLGLRYDARAVALSTTLAGIHSLCAVQVLVLAAYGTPNQDMAFVLGVTYNVLSSLLCGVWVTIDNLVAPLRWLSYVSYFRYTIDGLLQLQYAARDDGCGLFADVTPQARAAAQAGRAPLPTGRELCNGVLQHQDQQLSLASCFGGLLVLLALLHVASFASLVRSGRHR